MEGAPGVTQRVCRLIIHSHGFAVRSREYELRLAKRCTIRIAVTRSENEAETPVAVVLPARSVSSILNATACIVYGIAARNTALEIYAVVQSVHALQPERKPSIRPGLGVSVVDQESSGRASYKQLALKENGIPPPKALERKTSKHWQSGALHSGTRKFTLDTVAGSVRCLLDGP